MDEITQKSLQVRVDMHSFKTGDFLNYMILATYVRAYFDEHIQDLQDVA